jgi:hypothetical protein
MTLDLSLDLAAEGDSAIDPYPPAARNMLQEDDFLVLQEDGTSKIVFSLITD